MVMLSQPRCQFALVSFPVCDTESSRKNGPPFWNAFVANNRPTVEERAGLHAADKLPALRTPLHTEQSEGSDQIVEIGHIPLWRQHECALAGKALFFWAFTILTFAQNSRTTVSPAPLPKHFDHVLIFVLENQDYESSIKMIFCRVRRGPDPGSKNVKKL
jgi:hypothetical protein